MKIVTYNIQFGLGKDGQIDLDRIAGEVAGADIIALQEIDRNWQRSGKVDQASQLGAILNQYYWAYGPYFDVDASEVATDGAINNQRRQFGNMILSKTPIISTRLFPMPKSILHHRHNIIAGLFEGVVALPNGGAVRIYNAHLGARLQCDRLAQINTLGEIIHRAPFEGGAWTGCHVSGLWEENAAPPPMPEAFVLLGDFNLESSDAEYDMLVGPKDGDLGRISSAGQFADTWVTAGHPEDQGITYRDNTSGIQNAGMRIDYAFVGQSMKEQVRGAWIDDAAVGSDHQPYWIELDFPISDRAVI